MLTEPIPRLDCNPEVYEKLLPFCRLALGEVWQDPERGHRVGVFDATDKKGINSLLGGDNLLYKPVLAVTDPPYNIQIGKKKSSALFRKAIDDYLTFSHNWIKNITDSLADNAHFYIWLGADQSNGFQPLPELMIMLRDIEGLSSRSFITVRNQRGYGTQKNWMAIRQELLYYVKGNPAFQVVYTGIPKVLKGYYKVIGGRKTENLERSRSSTIRPGNVWLDIQQVFYRMEENVPGAYAQKSLPAIERILLTGSIPGDTIIDCFAHSGTTLIAAEKTDRICITSDIDPVFAELTIRRLERFRKTGKTGWQCEHPFPEIA